MDAPKYGGLYKNIMNSYVPTNRATQNKWTNSQNHTTVQD